MKRTIAALCLLAVPFTTSCTSSSTYAQAVGIASYELVRRDAPDGALEIYSLHDGRSVHLTTEYTRERPFLGFKTKELDKARAKRRGVRPYSGLLVTGTHAESSARLGGIARDDVLVSVQGEDVTNHEQLAAVEATLSDQLEVPVRVLRGNEEIELVLRSNLVLEHVRDLQVIRLEEPAPLPRPYAGVNLAGIPKVWSDHMFGEGKNSVVVSEVVVGSPAWLGGVRGGDLIEKVDGQPVPDVHELARRIRIRGEADKPMTWTVRREVGRTYDATIQLADFSGSSGLHIPILFHASSDVHEDVWRIGWGLVAGNRNRYIADQNTRVTKTSNTFSALLGLFKVTSNDRETRVRLLWFIRFDS
jgi:hypothetical protein